MKNKKTGFLYAAGMLIVILTMGLYYVYVLDLNRHRKVSDSYRYYYLDKKLRFWNKYQSMYVIPGHVYDTTIERPYFLEKSGVSAPESDGSGMNFSDSTALIFKMYKNPDRLYVYFRLKSEMGHTMITVGSHSTAYLDEPGSYEIYIPVEPEFIDDNPGTVNRVPVSTSLPVSIYALAITAKKSVPEYYGQYSLSRITVEGYPEPEVR